MRIYPAIHISDGRCVNLSANGLSRGKIFTSHPLKMAQKWEELGADFIHIIDIDGADSGLSVNSETIREIVENIRIPVQVGGGIRSIKDIDHYLSMGVRRVIIGTQAIEKPVFIKEAVNLFGSDRIMVAIDASDGMIATEGRKKFNHFNVTTIASNMKAIGIQSIIYTDILRRGLDNGAGIMQALEITEKLHMNVIYSGGIKSLKDIEAFMDMKIEGIIMGKALYESRVLLSDAINICRRHELKQDREADYEY
ncbi:MAG: HisA/HisF-related TIM barrel protein [Coprococcus sp.]